MTAALFTAGLLAYIFTSIRTTGTAQAADLRQESRPTIILTEEGFSPRAVRITRGQSITFTTTRSARFWPASDPHPEHTIYPGFDPFGPIAPEESWTFTVDRSGTWNFHDHIRSYFTGTLYVD